MPEGNIVSWNSLITCYEQNGPVREALVLFVRMMNAGFVPDEVILKRQQLTASPTEALF
jgi:pentatricopeptide repeat protein